MFFGDAAPGRKVTLRGSSKQQDRRAVLEQAKREREARQLQRQQQRSTVLIQAAFRRHRAQSALRARERAAWDAVAASGEAQAQGAGAVPALRALLRSLFVVCPHARAADAGDAERRRVTCKLLLANAALEDAKANLHVAMGVDLAWELQVRRIVDLCVRALVIARSPDTKRGRAASDSDGDVRMGAPGDRQVAPRLEDEERVVTYFTNSDAWAWMAFLPSLEHAQRARRAAHRTALAGAHAGLHEVAWASVAGTVVSAPDASREPAGSSGELPRLVLAPEAEELCAASLRAALAPHALDLGVADSGARETLLAFAASALTIPALWASLPKRLADLARANHRGLVHALQVLGCVGETAVRSVGPGGALRPTLHSESRELACLSTCTTSPGAPRALLGNAVSIAHECLVGEWTNGRGAQAPPSDQQRRALGAYVHLVHAALAPWMEAHAAAAARRPEEDDDSDDEAGTGAAGAGGVASAPMDVDLQWGAQAAALAHAVDRQVALLIDGAHSSCLFSALIAGPPSGMPKPAPPSGHGAVAAPGSGGAGESGASPFGRLCALYCLLLSHGTPLTLPARAGGMPSSSGPASSVHTLSALTFGHTPLAPTLWAHVRADAAARGGAGASGALAHPDLEGPLCLFCLMVNHALVVLSDDEVLGAHGGTGGRGLGGQLQGEHDQHGLLGRADLRDMCLALKELAVHLLWHTRADGRGPAAAGADGMAHSGHIGSLLRRELTKLLRAMHERDERLAFVSPAGDKSLWLAGGRASGTAATIMAVLQNCPPPAAGDAEPLLNGSGAMASVDGHSQAMGAVPPLRVGATTGTSAEALRASDLLRHVPFTLPFDGRLATLRTWIEADHGMLRRDRLNLDPVRVRRSSMVADSFAALRDYGSALKLPLRVQFFNDQGLEEAGIGEGVMKEYLVEVIRAACAPDQLLFTATAQGLIYPNPAARHAVSEVWALYEFVGAMFAKAAYEGILLDVPLAPFFLSKVLGRANTFNDLPLLDPELHRNLLFLKGYDGAVEDLALFFAVTDVVGGREFTTDLIPNGRNVHVTATNRTEYVYLMANYRLNAQLRRPAAAFHRGFTGVLPASWIAMFSPRELGMVLSGSDAPIDVADWRAHARYASGYYDDHPVIQAFWAVVDEMDESQRAAMLRFATSSARPPLLGFQWLSPPFCIQRATAEEGRLPTSATCMNLLKLPPYEDLDTMRSKLTYAINAGCGFELS
mmetsp:Transcript_5252/g.15373  ORF Transcript_5252/g.15373 Transcript_5252/m.15373 type:complete len:1221 (+) Transcript_5252:67-3729(+)